MKTSKLIASIAVLSLLIALAAFYIGFSARREALTPGRGNSLPNLAAGQDRVQNAEERARMERYAAQLQSSKQVVKSFPGPSGETIDCVDIYSQPALKRPGMEGHVVQLAPGRVPQAPNPSFNHEEKLQVPNQLFALTGETCPERSVPMERLTMDTLKRFRTLDEFFRKKYIDIRKPTGGNSGANIHEYAHAARSVNNWGAESIFNLWSPYVETTGEFSLSQMWVTRGSGASLQTVEGGWQVYHDLYGDWRAHLFIYFTPDNYGSGGCYNLSCNGFVQTNGTVYLAGGFTNYSSAGGGQPEFKLLWYKDGVAGGSNNWWLKYNDTWVGYYPRTLFNSDGLANSSNYVDFGGEIVNDRTDNRHTETDMGSGYWPYQGYGWAAYQRAVRYVDTSNYYQQATGLSRSVTNNMCYDLNLLSSTGSWEQYFYFGGSGRNTYCP